MCEEQTVECRCKDFNKNGLVESYVKSRAADRELYGDGIQKRFHEIKEEDSFHLKKI